MTKLKVLVLVVFAAALTGGAAWKWHAIRPQHAPAHYRIAGWTWTDTPTLANLQ